jgi:hypothetical protein
MLYILNELWACPITSLLLAISITLFYVINWSHIFVPRDLRYSSHDLVNKGDYWRAISSAFVTTDLLQLFLTVTSFWGIRTVEKRIGSIIFLEYCVIGCLSTAFFTVCFISLMRIRLRRLLQGLEDMSTEFVAPTSGLLDLTFLWLAHDSIIQKYAVENYYLFGILAIPVILAPLLLLFCSQVILPRSSGLVHMGALMTGYLLRLGPLAWIPSTYWAICFSLNMFIITYMYIHNPCAAAVLMGADDLNENNGGVNVENAPHELGEIFVRRFASHSDLVELVDLERGYNLDGGSALLGAEASAGAGTGTGTGTTSRTHEEEEEHRDTYEYGMDDEESGLLSHRR